MKKVTYIVKGEKNYPWEQNLRQKHAQTNFSGYSSIMSSITWAKNTQNIIILMMMQLENSTFFASEKIIIL